MNTNTDAYIYIFYFKYYNIFNIIADIYLTINKYLKFDRLLKVTRETWVSFGWGANENITVRIL